MKIEAIPKWIDLRMVTFSQIKRHSFYTRK